MNAVAKIETARPSLIATMAAKFNMDPKAFEQTVRSTVMPSQHTNEQFAALMMVAKEYDLNPLTKEIYAFPAKGGGIVPVVSIDGWLNLVNSHPACDGFDIEFHDDDNGQPISCTCRMYRKDRSRPVTVTEYLSECIRNTDPWKMKHRMLRHKAVIQAARYAFGFSGIYDEDEGAKIAEMRDVTPPTPPKPPVPPSAQIDGPAEVVDADTGEVIDQREIVTETGEDTSAVMDTAPIDYGRWFEEFQTAMDQAATAQDVAEVWNNCDPLATFEGDDDSQALAQKIKREAMLRIGGQK
jgi:phage recombination protein Bet